MTKEQWWKKNISDINKALKSTDDDIKPFFENAFLCGQSNGEEKTFEKVIPAIDLLQRHLERGCELVQQDGGWCLFDKNDVLVSGSKTLRSLIINLIWIDC